MMRVNKKLLDDLKILKEVKRGGSCLSLVDDLVKKELMKTHALTNCGYLKAGNVVSTASGAVLVINSVYGDRVTFGDGTFVINGGIFCLNLLFVCNSIDLYEGGAVNGK